MPQNPAPNARAIAHLAAVVAHCRKAATGRLPTLEQLASTAGVSHVTMLKAVDGLRGRGVLTTRRGSGIYLAGAPLIAGRAPAAPTAPGRPAHWKLTAQKLEDDVLAGVFRPDEKLPLVKVLCARYGVCSRTLGRALAQAEERMVLVPAGRRFRVRRPANRTSRSSVVLISAFRPGLDAASLEERNLGHMHGMEVTCAQQGLRLRKAFCWYEESTLTLTEDGGPLFSRKELANILGLAVLGRGLTGSTYSNLLLSLTAYGKPVSVLDERGDVTAALGGAVPAGLRVFSVGCGAGPGRSAARFLLGLGHRRVAYISLFHPQAWSANRLTGLLEGFARAGLTDAVVPLCMDQPEGQLRAALDLPTESSLWQPLAHLLGPSLRDLLRQRDVTAWVAANDAVGVVCLRFLKDERIPVPRRLSVMGFDDSIFSLISDLSSYNFNGSATISAMVSNLLRPTWPPLRKRPGDVVEVEGFVNERGSTGPAPRDH
jgi:DNA-binding transcriptional regulator YhcF (GntR family)